MADQLRNMMAEIESWESATEFGIPEELWAEYQVRQRSDDLYIAALSAVFNVLRNPDSDTQKQTLSELAKTLLVYSHSAASQYLAGIDTATNLLYCAATFYLADFPATATLVAKKINNVHLSQEEKFLFGLLSRSFNRENEIEASFIDWLDTSDIAYFNGVRSHFVSKQRQGLVGDPKLFIASKLIVDCLDRFSKFNIWDNLRENAANFSREIWQPFINLDAFPLWELFPSQVAAIKSGILGDEDRVYSLQMPTSAGKTSLCEILIYHEVKNRRKKVLFLVPFRALASEIKEGVSKRLENAGVTVIASHGGNIPTRSENATAESADVLIITPEKFMALAQNFPELEDGFDTVICDEGHLIDDSSRGLQYELLLTKLKSSNERTRKIIFISAILPNVDEIHQWLGGAGEQLSKSDYKPVETDFAFVVPQGTDSWRLDFNTIYGRPRRYFLHSFLTKNDLQYVNPATNRLKLIDGYRTCITLACATALKARKNGPVALFTTQKGKNGVAGLAKRMLDLCNLRAVVTERSPPPTDNLPDLIEYIDFQFGEDYSLAQLLRYGVGFHHGDLPQEIRREMEAAIQKGDVNILICTSTLAEGVNLPIRTLVVHTIKRFDGNRPRPIETRSIKNIVGRVGRAGKETRGRIIFANDNERGKAENVFRDIQMEPAYGALYKLITSLDKIVTQKDIQLTNEIFELQDNSFLSILDKIDIAIIGLIPPEVISEEIESHVETMLEDTLAYKRFDTENLKERIKEVFSLRAQHLQSIVPRDSWQLLKKSGSSPRFWRKIHESGLHVRPEWISLSSPLDDVWLNEVVLALLNTTGIDCNHELNVIKQAINGWMNGDSYVSIADACNLEIDATLGLLCHTIGYELQDAVSKLCQIAASDHEEATLSEIAVNWPSLLQYGLNSLQQLDLFDEGASDRLGVWGISRFLESKNNDMRKSELMSYLSSNPEGLRDFLNNDSRVPKISLERVCKELKISTS